MGFWQNDDTLTKYTTAPNTRSLSVTSNLKAISDATGMTSTWETVQNATTTMAILFYESPNSSVAVLSRIAKGCLNCPYSGNDYSVYTGDQRSLSWIAKNLCDPPVNNSDQSCVGSLHYFQSQEARTPFASSQYRHDTNFSVITFLATDYPNLPSETAWSVPFSHPRRIPKI